MPSRNAAKNFLRNAGLTPHHFDNTTIHLIPSDLHGNIPHIGSASDLRRGF
ncbi:MAG: HNH endonuclease [Planctomycetota bacterium]